MTPAALIVDDWWSCYGGSLKEWLVPSAFSHPAKFSRKLIERIYAHVLEAGWLMRGQRVLDPMAGVGIGGIAAIAAGFTWEGVELERRFVELAQANFEKHRRVWEALGKPLPTIRQGDARRLSGAANAIVTSPPYVDAQVSPQDREYRERDFGHLPAKRKRAGYQAVVSGQLGVVGNVQAVISSPPYVGGGHHPDQTGSWGGLQEKKTIGLGTKQAAGYGQTPGQIGRMSEGKINAVGQLGVLKGETYWSAMRQVYENCFALLPTGGHIILVVKAFVRKGAIVDFPCQTCALLEAIGFRVVHRHQAWLIANEAQRRFDGGEDRTARKSFFRRLQERHGTSRIDFEEVLCAERR